MALFAKTLSPHKNKYKKVFLVYCPVAFLLLLHCNSPADQTSSTDSNSLADQASSHIVKAKEVTLIFNHFPKMEKEIKTASNFMTWHMNSGLFFFDDLNIEDIDTPDNTKVDTLTLLPENNNIIIRCRYNFVDYYEYLVRKGDTLILSYQNGFPLVYLSNRKTLPYDLIFDDLVRKRYIKEKYAPVAKYTYTHAFINVSKPQTDIKKNIRAFEAQTYKEAIPFLENRQRLLDSLKSSKNISQDVYDFYKSRDYYLQQWLYLKEGNLTMEQISRLLGEDLQDKIPAFYRRQFVESVADKYIVEKADHLDLKDGINRDYRKAYIAVKNSTLFSEKDRNYLLTREMHRIANTFSQTDFHKFFNLYAQDVTDKAMIDILREEYTLKFEMKSTETKSVVLMSKDKTQLNFEEVKQRYGGKVMYVDFWASWCGPCREVMPQSIALKQSLKSSNVVFVYLSMDESFNAWQKASSKEGLAQYQDNYMIVNTSTSDFMKAQKVKAIPRYMIFDKKGKLVYPNAPSVESKELKTILVGLAK